MCVFDLFFLVFSVLWIGVLTLILRNFQFLLYDFSSPSVFSLHVCYTFLQLSQSLWVFCSLCFSILETFIDLSSNSENCQPCPLLLSPSKAFFMSVTVFLISSISLWFFLRIFIFLIKLPIRSCMLSTSSIRDLSTVIIVVLNYWSVIPTSLLCLVLTLALSLPILFCAFWYAL